jgi:hypothetical protein
MPPYQGGVWLSNQDSNHSMHFTCIASNDLNAMLLGCYFDLRDAVSAALNSTDTGIQQGRISRMPLILGERPNILADSRDHSHVGRILGTRSIQPPMV